MTFRKGHSLWKEKNVIYLEYKYKMIKSLNSESRRIVAALILALVPLPFRDLHQATFWRQNNFIQLKIHG